LDREAGVPVGTVGFNALGSVSEIAYHLHPTHWGKGFMFEANEAAIDWLLAQGNCTELEAFVDPDNKSSIRLAERLGLCAADTLSEDERRYCRNSVSARRYFRKL